MCAIQTIATDVSALFVSLSVCLSCGFTQLWCAKMAEQIEVVFGVKNLGGSRNIGLDAGF